ncbi:MAG: phosphoribosylamine--glycine ligase [Acidobacteriota bacterium]
MKILVIGSGGREHALCWKLRQSPRVTEVYCAPGNPGIAEVADLVPIPADEIHQLADFAAELKIELTIVGPELPLTLGVVDEFHSRGLSIFGPNQNAAELEGSKVFAKEFMRRHGIPTADFGIAHDADEARQIASRFGFPVVLKADGLAAGKGVLIPKSPEELEDCLGTFFDQRRFGAAGDRVVVEEFLEGEEVSFTSVCDGQFPLPLATCKDYKRLLDDDQGPNTGGMGCHSPGGVLGSGAGAMILDQVVRPTLAGMAAENRTFTGVLYAGLVLTEAGPKVLEFNTRFGDPETQALMMRLDTDLVPILVQAAAGRFETLRLTFRKETSACIVLASKGYPEKPIKGDPITGLDALAEMEGVEVFHSGTALREGQLVASGGRVLNVCATGTTLRDALKKAYLATHSVQWPNKHVRNDIGRRVLERSTGA